MSVCRTQHAGAFVLIPLVLALARRAARALAGPRAPVTQIRGSKPPWRKAAPATW